jgi:uncharacterized protein YbjQ (UPF0145 family)
MSKRPVILMLLWALGAAIAPAAQARDNVLHLPIKDVLENPDYKNRLGDEVALYFGSQAAAGQGMGEYVTNKKTNAFGKSDEKSCQWAMLSALLELVERARKENANAVVNIVSYYKRIEFVSDTEYECHAGGVIAGVTLKGKVVKTKK